jgi:hypothetical protein
VRRAASTARGMGNGTHHRHTSLALGGLVAVASLGLVWSCLTFNGLTVPDDAAADGGDAGVDAPVDAGFTSYLSLSQAGAVCSLTFQCPGLVASIAASIGLVLTPLTGKQSFAYCMNALAGPVDPNRLGLETQRAMLSAIAGANGCQEAINATFVQLVVADADSGPCTPGESCNGDYQVTCAGSPPTAFQSSCDSPLLHSDPEAGTSCITFLHDGGTFARCNQDAGCNGIAFTCQGDTVLWCDTSVRLDSTFDCTVTGRSCTDTVGLAHCQDICLDTNGFAWGCSNSAIRYCAGPSIQAAFPCTANRACLIDSMTSAPYCKGPNDTCTPFDSTLGACQGSTISLCINGAPATFDCTKLPMQTCLPANDKANQLVHCGPIQ